MTGRDSADKLVELQRELISPLKQGGLSLRKWSSNCTSVLQAVPAEHCVTRLPLQDHLEMDIKLLGVPYNATKDKFFIQTHATETVKQLTKRQLLGEIARVYDPCGWLDPLVVVSKLILQRLWKENVSGDLTSMWTANRLSYPLRHI
ncbi:unnamed protein product [Macrosiphum euphorbiae]|uniref:Uncharacterized protein n=1 Tax=Macrosiphum euphorbiae TaxID=13131 RepID=A0AAV0WST7_9HEMI|nr:unnamed protein product [Macrosiphum euphorbiae]